MVLVFDSALLHMYLRLLRTVLSFTWQALSLYVDGSACRSVYCRITYRRLDRLKYEKISNAIISYEQSVISCLRNSLTPSINNCIDDLLKQILRVIYSRNQEETIGNENYKLSFYYDIDTVHNNLLND